MFNIFNTIKQQYYYNQKEKRKWECRAWSRDSVRRLKRIFKLYEIEGFEKAYLHTVSEIKKLRTDEVIVINKLHECFNKLKESDAYKITTSDWEVSNGKGDISLIHRTPKKIFIPSIYLKIIDMNNDIHEFALENEYSFNEKMYDHRKVIDNFLKSLEQSVYTSKKDFVQGFAKVLKNEYYWEEFYTYFNYCMIAADNLRRRADF